MAQHTSKEAPDDSNLSEDLGGRYQAEGYGDDPYTENAQAGEEHPMRSRRFSFDIDKAADQWIDGLIPEEIEWRGLVGKYPRISVGLALVAGFLIGRTQGKALIAVAGAVAIEEVSKLVEDSVGDIFT